MGGALYGIGLASSQAAVPLPLGFSSDRLPQCRGRLAGFCAPGSAASAFTFACAFASASCLLAACSFAHCGGGAGAGFGGGPFAAVGAAVAGGSLTGTDGGGGGAGAAGGEAAAMGTENGAGSTVRAGGLPLPWAARAP